MKQSYIFTSVVLIFILCSYKMFGQITITDSISNQQVIQTLQGEGVVITNLQITNPLDTGKLPSYGLFNDPFGSLGMNKGLIMTNGAAVNAVGPNDEFGKTQENDTTEVFDPDLRGLLTDTTVELRDICIIEFDIVISSNLLIFNYIFGSDEYPEFLDYNDVFGFFISGPGITGVKNIATVPGSTIPVSVSNINHLTNSEYYVNNGNGSTPSDNIDIQYDGYTTTLQAKADVIPCETYHIKLAIADAGSDDDDQTYDTGVFLEENSFSSGVAPELEVHYEFNKFDRAIEECNDAYVVVSRNKQNVDQSNRIVYYYQIDGSADNGVDYVTITDSIVLEAGEEKDSILIRALQDNVEDDNENVILNFSSGCDQIPNEDEKIIVPIHEYYNHPLNEASKCGNATVVLNSNPNGSDSISWVSSEYLSCTNCQSPIANNPVDTFFWFYAVDKQSGCHSFDSVEVKVYETLADFDFHYEQCYTTVDVFFDDQSKNADSLLWNFGDGSSSKLKDPHHQYTSAINQTESQFFDVTLTVINNEFQCKDTVVKTIDIETPLKFPNIITPNNDFVNDVLDIVGINGNCWTIMVYNRWGKLVYEEENYANNYSPSDLPDGTYFYRFLNNNQDFEYKGYLEVYR